MLIHRRSFLQSSLALGAGVLLAPPLRAAALSHRASVIEFGADPTGAKDATAAVRRAIASLAPNDARLVFPTGVYRFAASNEVAMQFTGFRGVELYANNAQLLFAGNTLPFAFRSCRDIALHDMNLDWESPSFSQGIVRETDPRFFTIDIDPAFPVTGSERIAALAEFDPQTRRPAARGLLLSSLSAPASLVAPQQLRIALPATSAPVRRGMLLLLVHTAPALPAAGSFTMDDCQGILIEGVTVRHSPATAFLVRGCRDLHLEDVNVSAAGRVGAQRLLAAVKDGLHCSNCHGNLFLKDVQFEGIGGDAVNIYQSYWKIAQRLDDRTVLMTTGTPQPFSNWELPAPGDFVQFSSPADLQLLGEIGISSVERTGSESAVRLTFSETLSPVIVPGTLVCSVVDAPRISLDHATIANTLGRGLVIHTRGEITNNRFQGCAQEAILLAPDAELLQGPAIQTIRIRTNSFEDCATAANVRAVIAIDASQQQTPASTALPLQPTLNSGIQIQGNTFIHSTGAAIYAAGVDDLVIQENHLGHAPAAPGSPVPVAIVLNNVANAELSGNISNVPQTIAMSHCADTVAAQDNRFLTTAKLA